MQQENKIGTARKRESTELIEVKVVQRSGDEFLKFFDRHDALRVSNDGWYQTESLKNLFERRSA
jgi:hypothetical protein